MKSDSNTISDTEYTEGKRDFDVYWQIMKRSAILPKSISVPA